MRGGLGVGRPRNAYSKNDTIREIQLERTEKLSDEMHGVATMALSEMRARLADDARRARMTDYAINAVYGTLIDKIGLKEAWGVPEAYETGETWIGQFAQVLERVRESGLSLKLEVGPHQPMDVGPIFDVPLLNAEKIE